MSIEKKATAFVLHSRAYQENSAILQLFSLQYGRFSALAKGIKGKRSQARKALLQPFHELALELTGKGELKTITHCELADDISGGFPDAFRAAGVQLQGQQLACGFYANELIIRVLPEDQDVPELYQSYAAFLNQLKKTTQAYDAASDSGFAPLLRNFEVGLLTVMGIAPDWSCDINHNPIDKNRYYSYQTQSGFYPVELREETNSTATSGYQTNRADVFDKRLSGIFSGQSILSLAAGKYCSSHLKACQQITRLLLREVIGDKPLQSRKLWQHRGLQNTAVSGDGNCSDETKISGQPTSAKSTIASDEKSDEEMTFNKSDENSEEKHKGTD
ncbi:DNA repair protein RecO [Aliikangiella coralliicola]|uniref:DNA repair protein RecO n=1 Tax=Aliikangiella coralliicola TaxID=2592383 RepID=A0A545UB67_9GAMM|nr:DNA repair protein RecO [Aliikangiella coralliicola]TQV86673.1 DNA repair protein RecO [Aliikangiella coralliicola]